MDQYKIYGRQIIIFQLEFLLLIKRKEVDLEIDLMNLHCLQYFICLRIINLESSVVSSLFQHRAIKFDDS